MKTITKLVSATALAAIILVSCKKDDPTPIPTTIQKIQAKWTFDKLTDLNIFMGTSTRDTLYGTAAEYVDFRTDNKVYSFIDSDYDTASYTLLNDNKIIMFDNTGYRDTSDIRVLNINQLQLFSTGTYTNGYYENTLFLKK